MKDTVSICVPIYNTGKYLKRCIDSLIAQTYSNIEIVLVDDGSTDNCGLICDEYAKQDPRIVVVHQKNKGEAAARNTGLQEATGEYVMFIDSDDEYRINAVQLLIDGMKTNDVDLAIGGYLEKNGQIEHFATGHQRRYSASEAARVYLTTDCQYGMPYIASTINGKLFRRQIISRNNISYDERFVIGNDMIFMCEYLKYTRTVYDVFAPIYVYYKYQPEERVQGMAWYYPDGFFLFAYVADRMIKLAQPDEIEYKQLIVKQYKDFLYALVNATANKEYFDQGIIPYLTSFCNEIDFIQIGAKLDVAEGYIAKEDGALPIRLISYHIVNKRFDELYELLTVIANERKITPYQGDTVRQMIHLKTQHSEDNAKSTVSDSSGNLGFEDEFIVEQVSDLVTTIAAKQLQMDAYEAEIGANKVEIDAYKAKVDANKAEIDAYKAKVDVNKEEIDAYKAEIDGYKAKVNANKEEIDAYKAEIDGYKAKVNANKEEIDAYKAEIDGYKAKVNANKEEIDAYKAEIADYVASTSWRVTKPLRAIKGYLKRN